MLLLCLSYCFSCFLVVFLLILGGLCIDYLILFNGISEANELQGMCLMSHLSRVASVTKTFYKDFQTHCFSTVLAERTGTIIPTPVVFLPLLEMVT